MTCAKGFVMLQLMSRATVRLAEMNARILRFFSVVRYLAYSAAKIISGLVFWAALFYVMHPWTGQGGFPTGDLIFLTWSVLSALLCDSIYRSLDSHIDTLVLESPVHGSLALLFAVSAVTAVGFGSVACQNLISGVHSLVWPPIVFPDYFLNSSWGNWQKIFFGGVLYIGFMLAATAMAISAGRDIIHDIAYHKNLISMRGSQKK